MVAKTSASKKNNVINTKNNLLVDIGYKLRKWSKKERDSAVELRTEYNYGPKKISEITGIPIVQIKFWIYGTRKITPTSKKRTDNYKENSRKTYYRTKYNDWIDWKTTTLSSSLRRVHVLHKDSGDPPTITEIKEWLSGVKYMCHYCGTTLDEKNFSVDHLIPVSRNGKNNFENIRQCCKSCNTAKGKMTDIEFVSLLKLISSWEDSGKVLLGRLKGGYWKR